MPLVKVEGKYQITIPTEWSIAGFMVLRILLLGGWYWQRGLG